MGKCELDLEQEMDLHRAVSYLEDLAISLRSGTVAIEHGEESITLRPAGKVELRLKVSQDEDREVCSIKIAWNPQQTAARDCHLRITGEPATV